MRKSEVAAESKHNNHEVKGNNGKEVLNRERNILIVADECQQRQQKNRAGLFIDADAVQISRFSIRPRAMSPILEA